MRFAAENDVGKNNDRSEILPKMFLKGKGLVFPLTRLRIKDTEDTRQQSYLIHNVLFINKFWFVLVHENAYQIILRSNHQP